MNSGTVGLIATDPPFNKGRDFHATPESLASGASFQDRWSWKDDVHQDWIDRITDSWPNVIEVINAARTSYGDDMGAYLCFMGVRLIEMRRVLRGDGSIYLHCDPTASHYLKMLMDGIFGAKGFRNEIIWKYGLGGSSKKMFSKKHDVILFYTKSKSKWYFDKPLESSTSALMAGRPKGMTDVWDIPTINNMAKERTGYPTQKPLALYKRIIKASSDRGDIVLDPFCGCATTPVAAEQLSRNWVGIDIWNKAHEMVIKRLKDEGDLAGPTARAMDLDMQVLGKIHFVTGAPIRTDDGKEEAPPLEIIKRTGKKHASGKKRKELLRELVDEHGLICFGCGRRFDSERYLELDHNNPRSTGGKDEIGNVILLCGPCNRLKSNRLTLPGLQQENKKLGYMFRVVKVSFK